MQPLYNSPENWAQLLNNCHEKWDQVGPFEDHHNCIYREWFTGKLVNAEKKPHFWYQKASFKDIVKNLDAALEGSGIKDPEKTRKILERMVIVKNAHLDGIFSSIRECLSRIQNKWFSRDWKYGSQTSIEVAYVIIQKLSPKKEVERAIAHSKNEPRIVISAAQENFQQQPVPQIPNVVPNQPQAQQTIQQLPIQPHAQPQMPINQVNQGPNVVPHKQDTQQPLPQIPINQVNQGPNVVPHKQDTQQPVPQIPINQVNQGPNGYAAFIHINPLTNAATGMEYGYYVNRPNQVPAQPIQAQPPGGAVLPTPEAANNPAVWGNYVQWQQVKPKPEPVPVFVNQLQPLGDQPVKEYLSLKLKDPYVKPTKQHYYSYYLPQNENIRIPQNVYSELIHEIEKNDAEADIKILGLLDELRGINVTNDDVNATKNREIALWAAAARGSLYIVENLVELGAKNERIDRGGRILNTSALHEAVKANKLKVVHYLLANGANPAQHYDKSKVRDKINPNPIIVDAISNGDLMCVKLLVTYALPNNDIFKSKEYFNTLLDLAKNKNQEIYRYLLTLKIEWT